MQLPRSNHPDAVASTTPLRRALVARHALRAFAACAALITLAVLAGVAPSRRSAARPARGSRCSRWARSRRGRDRARGACARDIPRFEPWLEALEQRCPALRSCCATRSTSRRASDAHTSGSLADALRDEAARRARRHADRAPRGRASAARAPLLGATVAAGGARGARPRSPRAPALRAWRTLWDPSLAAPPVTLAVEPGSVTRVARRDAGRARARRRLRRGARACSATARTRRRSWRPSSTACAAGASTCRRVTRARHYAVRVLAARSPDYRIDARRRAAAGQLHVRVPRPGLRAAAESQSGTSTRGDVAALRGSVATVEVTFDRDLESLVARLPGGTGRRPGSAVTPRRWRGKVAVEGDGEWSLRAEAATRRGHLALARERAARRAAGDHGRPARGRPGPAVRFAGPVRRARAGRSRAVATCACSSARTPRSRGTTCRSRRSRASRARRASPPRGTPRRWRCCPARAARSASSCATTIASAVPRAPRAPSSTCASPPWPSCTRTSTSARTTCSSRCKQVADQARELQKTLDQLQRQQPRPGSAHAAALRAQPRRCARRSSASRRSREQLAEGRRGRAPELCGRGRTAGVQRGAAAEAARDVRADEADPVARVPRRDAAHARGARTHGPGQHGAAAAALREANRDLLQSVERNLALLRQLRDEERMDALARRADELKQQQDALNREHRRSRSPAPRRTRDSPPTSSAPTSPAQREAAAQQSEQLAREARDAAAEGGERRRRKQDLEAAAQTSSSSRRRRSRSRPRRRASPARARRPRSPAGRPARASPGPRERLHRGSDSAQRERDERQLAAVRRSAQDLVSLGQEASRQPAADGSAPTDTQANRQTDLSEGVARVADSLATLAQRDAAAAARGAGSARPRDARRCRARAASSRRAIARAEAAGPSRATARCATPSTRCAGRGEHVPERRRQEARPGQGPEAPRPGEALGQLSSQQGQLNERSSELARRMSQAMRLSAGDRRRCAGSPTSRRGCASSSRTSSARTTSATSCSAGSTRRSSDMQQVEEQLREGTPGRRSRGTAEPASCRACSTRSARSTGATSIRSASRAPAATSSAPAPAPLPGVAAARERPAAARPHEGRRRPLPGAVPRAHRALPAAAERVDSMRSRAIAAGALAALALLAPLRARTQAAPPRPPRRNPARHAGGGAPAAADVLHRSSTGDLAHRSGPCGRSTPR